MLEDTPFSTVELRSAVKSMHQVTRYGHASDFSFFFSSETSEKNDYVLGIVLVLISMIAIGTFWFLILLILRLLGQRVGCANGKSATIPAEAMKEKGSINFGDAATEDSGEFIVMQADQNRINRIRIAFFACGLLALATAGLSVFSAVRIQLSFNVLHENASEIQGLFTHDLINLGQGMAEFETAKNSLSLGLVGFCKNSADISELASNLSQAFSDIDDISLSFDWIHEVKDIITTSVDFLDSASVWFICLMAFASLSILGTVFFLLLAWKSGNAGFEFVGEIESTRGHRLIHFVAIPLYTLLAYLAWLGAGAAFAGATVNADFCYDEILTGHGVHKILEQKGFNSSSDTFTNIDSYLHDCHNQDLVLSEVIQIYDNNITDAMVFGDKFLALPGDELNDCLDDNDTTFVTTLITNATDRITKLQAKVLAIKSDTSCEEVAPLVQVAVYQSGCQSVFTNFMWTWVSFLGLAIWCTLILTLKTAIYRPQIYIVPHDDEGIEPIDSYDDSRHSNRGRSITNRKRSRPGGSGSR